jgi:hypothetical protein
MEPLDSFYGLKKFANGKISAYELQDVDPIIERVRTNSQNLAQSELTIEFDDDVKFFNLFDISDDDVWFMKMINSYYSDYEFMDYYSVKEDFLQGYTIFGHFDDENIEKLRQVNKLIYSRKFDLEDEDFRKGLANRMFDAFNFPTQNILNDYQTEKNREMIQVAQKTINKEVNDYFKEFDFEFTPYAGLKTTVANLIMWYIRTNSVHLPIEELLKKVFETSRTDIGGWHEYSYDYQNDEYFDNESFNRTVSRSLDEILEKIEDGYEREGFDLKSYIDMVDRITKKYGSERWHKLPKKPKEVRFKVIGFDKNPNKIEVKLQKDLKERSLRLSEENFYNLLYQPTLFNFDDI